MAPWGWVAGGYGVFLTLTAIRLPGLRRRAVAIAACAGYAMVAAALATLDLFWIHLVAPGALLLGGYWLSGLFYRDPQPRLERWLAATDRWVFEQLPVNRALAAAPRLLVELLEAAYTADYIVVAAGAFVTASAGVDPLIDYWTAVLAAELACYGALPFLRSRPPRALEPPGAMARRAPALRALNIAILDRASVQANTIPSGHVAGAVAAALAVMPVSFTVGLLVLGAAALIAISAVAGRYHYAVDCVLGAMVALVVALVTWPSSAF